MEFPFYSDTVDMKKSGDIDGFTYKFVLTFPPITETLTFKKLIDV